MANKRATITLVLLAVMLAAGGIINAQYHLVDRLRWSWPWSSMSKCLKGDDDACAHEMAAGWTDRLNGGARRTARALEGLCERKRPCAHGWMTMLLLNEGLLPEGRPEDFLQGAAQDPLWQKPLSVESANQEVHCPKMPWEFTPRQTLEATVRVAVERRNARR